MIPNSSEAARRLYEKGLVVLPVRHKSKPPIIEFQSFIDGELPEQEQIDTWFPSTTNRNLWVLCGAPSGYVVLDIDSDQAEKVWRELGLGDVLDATASVQTANGKHYWFRIPGGRSDGGESGWRSWSVHDRVTGVDFDVQGDGKGVLVPPSVHPNGQRYVWERPLEHAVFAPDALRRSEYESRVLGHPGLENSNSDVEEARSLLTSLLDRRPSKGGRNVWLTQVAGHLAHWIPHRDAFESMLAYINNGLSDPLIDPEVAKISESIWKSEQTKAERAGVPTLDLDDFNVSSGYLVGDGDTLWTLAKEKDEDGEPILVPTPWALLDIEVRGRTATEEGTIYECTVRSRNGQFDLSLNPSDHKFVDQIRGIGTGLGLAVTDKFNNMGRADRLASYMESQAAQQLRAVNHLGWNDEAGLFIHKDGAISAEGVCATNLRATGQMRRAKYNYGMGDWAEAQDILRQVMGFHDEQVCAVFGSWWAATLIKGQLMRDLSLFPLCAIESPSGTGKTTGFFPMLLELGGRQGPPMAGMSTYASIRDSITYNRNGVVWLDDITYLDDRTMELLRQTTAEGEITKKGEDRTSQVAADLWSAVMLSAESMNALHREKAMMDRTVLICNIPDPSSRRSLLDPSQPQWDDILDLRKKGDLTQWAGTMVQHALEWWQVEQPNVRRMRSSVGGRIGSLLATLRCGSQLLGYLAGWDESERSEWDGIVEDWAETYVILPNQGGYDNMFTTEILPRLVLHAASNEGVLPTNPSWVPVFWDPKDSCLYIQVPRVVEWWGGLRGLSERERTLGEMSSIQAQLDRIEAEGNIQRKFRQDGQQHNWRWTRIPEQVSRKVLERAEMDPTRVERLL